MWTEKEKKFIQEHLEDDVKQLALQANRYSKELDNNHFTSLLSHLAARQQIRDKIPSWYTNPDLIFPPKLSVEQASSEVTARYKSTLISGKSLLDLTGGMGIDTAFLSNSFEKVTYVEQQQELVEVARHNFQALGIRKIESLHEDAVSFLNQTSPVDCIYLDPARRSKTGKKLVLIEDCEPNLIEIQDLLFEKAQQILIKLSPMLDITAVLKTLKNIHEIHILSVDNDCKEILCLITHSPSAEPIINCINFTKEISPQIERFTYEKEKHTPPVYTSEIKEFLYEPNSAILKGGFYKSIAVQYGLEKLNPDSHLYTSTNYIPDFPGRRFRVEETSSLNKQALKTFLSNMDAAHITVRNFPLSVDNLRKRLKLKDGGQIYLFASTLANGKHILIRCQKPAHF